MLPLLWKMESPKPLIGILKIRNGLKILLMGIIEVTI